MCSTTIVDLRNHLFVKNWFFASTSQTESFEQRWQARRRRVWGKAAYQGEHAPSGTFPTPSWAARVTQMASVRTSSMLGRYSSTMRAACANERSCGSVRATRHLVSLPRSLAFCRSENDQRIMNGPRDRPSRRVLQGPSDLASETSQDLYQLLTTR